MDNINLAFNIGVVLSILWIVGFFILVFKTSKKFDKLLRSLDVDLPPNLAITLPDFMGRSGAYCGYIVRELFVQKVPLKGLPEGFRFTNYASKFDLVLVTIQTILSILFIADLVILFFVH